MIDESVLTMQQRQKRAMNMRRNKEKLRRARERAKTRQAPETKRPTEEGRRGGPHLAGVIGLETPGHGLTHMAVLRSGGGAQPSEFAKRAFWLRAHAPCSRVPPLRLFVSPM
jgi:hypothetical protein